MFYKASWAVIAPLTRVLFNLKIEGARNLPKRGPAILASNHLSFLDHFLLGAAVPRQIFFISKSQHFDYPIRKYLVSSWGVIPLRRGEGDQEAFERSVEALKAGNLFAIYPEGTRSLDGKLHKGHTGVARLALLSGAPVVPVAMMGTFEAMPKGQNVPKRVACGVRFGKAFHFENERERAKERENLRAITDRVMFAIRDLSGQEYVNEYQYNPEVKTHAKAGEREGVDGGASKSEGAKAVRRT